MSEWKIDIIRINPAAQSFAFTFNGEHPKLIRGLKPGTRLDQDGNLPFPDTVDYYPEPKWIKCSDALPEPYEYVLVFARSNGMGEPSPISLARHTGIWQMLNYTPESNAVAGDLTWYMNDDEITHWMPLPNPPEIK